MSHNAASFVWPQFILGAALERVARRFGDGAADQAFCYADTHAGPGVVSGALPKLPASLVNSVYLQTLSGNGGGDHPGSWITAARVLRSVFPHEDGYDLDINDIDPEALAQAKVRHETGRLRLWSHDWFKFLRSRLSMARPPHFVFIDPPPDDPRGPEFAVNAALLLDTVKCPYVMTYHDPMPQYVINLIGRTAVEIVQASSCTGVVLGGGAETVLLSILPDLKLLAQALDGAFAVLTPRNDDYTI